MNKLTINSGPAIKGVASGLKSQIRDYHDHLNAAESTLGTGTLNL